MKICFYSVTLSSVELMGLRWSNLESALESMGSNVIFICQLCDVLSFHIEKVSYMLHYCAQQVDVNEVKTH